MVVIVRVTVGLRRVTGGIAVVQAQGETIGEALESLCRQFPGFRERLYDESGALSGSVGVYYNGENISFLRGLDTPLREGGEITLLSANAGE